MGEVLSFQIRKLRKHKSPVQYHKTGKGPGLFDSGLYFHFFFFEMLYTYNKECRFPVYILESFDKCIHPNQEIELFHHHQNFPLIKKRPIIYMKYKHRF